MWIAELWCKWKKSLDHSGTHILSTLSSGGKKSQKQKDIKATAGLKKQEAMTGSD